MSDTIKKDHRELMNGLNSNNHASKTRIRWGVAGFMWFAIAVNYLDRTVLSAAAPHLIKDLGISIETMGIIMSAFFWTYALCQIPAGMVSDRFGQKKGLGFSVLIWSMATSAMGLASGFVSLLSLRLFLGAGEAGAYPSNAGITAKWFPDRERGTVSGLFDSAGKFGGAIALPLIAWMIAMLDWRLTFVIVGSLGIFWSVLWYFFFSDTPEENKFISQEEVNYIRNGQVMKHGGGKHTHPMKWYQLLRYRNVWAMCLGFFTSNYISYFFITWLPMYLMKDKGMDLISMGLIAAVPMLCGMFAEIIAGYVSDKMRASGRFSLTATRKIIMVTGMTMALCIGIAPFTNNITLIVVLLCLAKSGTAISASQNWAMPGDIAPRNMTSTLAGLQNMVANFGGVAGPIVTGFIVSSTGSFNMALIFSGAVGFTGILIYLFLLKDIKPLDDDNGKEPLRREPLTE